MAEKKPNIIGRIGRYFKNVVAEFKKVVWPTFKQTVNNTTIVIVSIILVGLVIGLLDMLFGYGLQLLLNREGAQATAMLSLLCL